MTTDKRTLNFPKHGTISIVWRPLKAIQLELERHPGGDSALTLNNSMEISVEDLDRVIDALREARYTMGVLSEITRPAFTEPESEPVVVEWPPVVTLEEATAAARGLADALRESGGVMLPGSDPAVEPMPRTSFRPVK